MAMRKNNVRKTEFLVQVGEVRVYKHTLPGGMDKYSLRKGRHIIAKKLTFAMLPRELQKPVADAWQRKRMLNIA